MSLWERYKSSLKPLSVEEPIDVVWHRLMGYAIARASFHTPLTPDAITMIAIVVGVSAGVCIAVPFAHHLPIAAALLTLSAMLDCADGQLARMRKSSSAFGRMLDGVCDSIVLFATLAGTMIHFYQRGTPWWVMALAVLGGPACSFHFAWYDHYKNVFLRFTEPTYREGEDAERALARHRAMLAKNPPGLVMRIVWFLYLSFVEGQAWLLRWSDPHTSARLDRFPPYDANRAAIYSKHALGPMRVWRSFFGLGSHIFVMSLAIAFDRIELYVFYRVIGLSMLALLILLPYQRRASRAAFEEMGLTGHGTGSPAVALEEPSA